MISNCPRCILHRCLSYSKYACIPVLHVGAFTYSYIYRLGTYLGLSYYVSPIPAADITSMTVRIGFNPGDIANGTMPALLYWDKGKYR
jgi:hypothetical protein